MRQIVRLPSQLGAVIQTHRLGKGLTQTELARLAGTQQKTISAPAGNICAARDTICSERTSSRSRKDIKAPVPIHSRTCAPIRSANHLWSLLLKTCKRSLRDREANCLAAP